MIQAVGGKARFDEEVAVRAGQNGDYLAMSAKLGSLLPDSSNAKGSLPKAIVISLGLSANDRAWLDSRRVNFKSPDRGSQIQLRMVLRGGPASFGAAMPHPMAIGVLMTCLIRLVVLSRHLGLMPFRILVGIPIVRPVAEFLIIFSVAVGVIHF